LITNFLGSHKNPHSIVFKFMFQGMQSEFVMNEAINTLFLFPQAGFVRKYCNSLDINATT
jgi:hypothetical protein